MKSIVVVAMLVACHPHAVAKASDPVRDVIAAFDRHRVVIIGESHGLREAGAFYVQLVRHPDFAKTVQAIVVEFASRQSQPLLDRYIAGDAVPPEQVRTIWRDTTKVASWESPIYADWLAAIRDVNAKLPAERRIRVLAGDSAIEWMHIRDHAAWAAIGDNNVSFARAIDDAVDRGQHVLVVEGSNHTMKSGDRNGAPNTTTRVEQHAPGATYVILLSVPKYFHDDAVDAQLGAQAALVPLVGTGLAKHGDALLYLGRELTEMKPPPGAIEPAYLQELDRRAQIEWGEPRHRKLLGIP
jgi:hypothetical protein